MNTPHPALLHAIERSLARGLALKRWWEATGGSAAGRRFRLVTTFHRPDTAFSFFDVAPFGRRGHPVMGDVEDLLYDRPKSGGSTAAAARWMSRQVREFALCYALRVMDTRQPTVLPEGTGEPPPLPLQPFSWCSDPSVERQGFGFSQIHYKLRDGRVGAFPDTQRFAIVDLRELQERYQWITLLIRVFDFDLEIHPLGPRLPGFVIPLREEQLVVISPDFVVDREQPAPGVLSEHGFGYAVVHLDDGGIVDYGPGNFEAGFVNFHFRVLASGETRLRQTFMVNRPRRLLNVSSLSPIFGSIALANLLSGGLAGRRLCISREHIEREMLVKHFLQVYGTVLGSIATWRQVPDWLDRAALPDWALTGISS